MYSFKNDYSEGAHPRILEALINSNMDQEEGYGLDKYSLKAASFIKKLLGDPECGVHLISGGTQTNLLAISSFLRPHEACISAASGHIATHETGAIEATGHKILTVPTRNGKLTPDNIESILLEHQDEHMVKPKLVYISNPTELGTIYSKEELMNLHNYCQIKNLLLYADGARLGSALTSKASDVTFKDMYNLTDAFFIGGTKTGALLGEALVVKNPTLKEDFRFLIKQRGALLAKGRILGIQFEELFRDDLYFELARHSNEMASRLATGLEAEGCTFLINSPTNQIFPIMKNTVINELTKEYDFYIWEKVNETSSAIRLVTSWATKKNDIDRFIDTYTRIKA